MDGDGKFHLIGRGGDYVINTGGEKVHSEEVEAVLKDHPAILDAAMVGVPDPRWGQAVIALVRSAPGKTLTDEEVIGFCRNRMAGYKRPRHLFFVDRVPRAVTGKIDRAAAIALVPQRFSKE